ncbi:K(+)-transporting ATPase subunit C [Streptomyces corynorhini]|uniref:Potassium-transporting ATPase KdpC subunit n=1 Tax=Streptomyces corynorhini TaxID=2282652 RepID=A0A370BEK5_9ACTN|nr:K(+)-transporting ATPase subunit C [Streptomyces corynorhini]RDG40081.1 K(+)-transporting ATPase subunit C [Streptomyces corynorhini]
MNSSAAATARLLGAALRSLLVLTVLCGVLYPLAVTGLAQAFFPHRAAGSEVREGGSGRVVGSSLIGQRYDLPARAGRAPAPDPRWFQPRPSDGLVTSTVDPRHRPLLSGATNLAGDNPELIRSVEAARAAVIEDNSTPGHPVRAAEIPADALTSSGSGLDPDISPAYARLQTHRVAERNRLPVRQLARLVEEHTQGRALGFVGEPRVNVLALNTALRELLAGR